MSSNPVSKVTLVTLVPNNLSELQQQWLDRCVESVKHTSFNQVLIPTENETEFYVNRVQTFRRGGLMACLDYDDYLIPEAAEKLYQLAVDYKTAVCFSHEMLCYGDQLSTRPQVGVSPRDVTQHQMAIHHLAILNSSLIPHNLIVTLEGLKLHKNIDWICKAYAALKFGAIQFRDPAYVWRQTADSWSKKWQKDYMDIYKPTVEFLKCLAPGDATLLKPYPVVEI